MLSCVLIDDEPNAVRALELELRNTDPAIEVVEKFTDAREAVAFLKQTMVDLVFLDIQMPGMDGLQFLEQFSNRNFLVIFTTAYSQHAIKAIKLSAIDYLLKPIDVDELKAAVEKARQLLLPRPFEVKLEAALNRFSQLEASRHRIKFNHEGKILFLKPEEIMYCKGEGNYCYIFLENNENLLLTQKLKQIEEQLPASSFFRVHNSYIVNLSKVKAYHKAEGMIELYSSFFVPVSRDKRSNIPDLL